MYIPSVTSLTTLRKKATYNQVLTMLNNTGDVLYYNYPPPPPLNTGAQ